MAWYAVPYEIIAPASKILPMLASGCLLSAAAYLSQRQLIPAAVTMSPESYVAGEQQIKAHTRQGSPRPVEINPFREHNMHHSGFLFWGMHPTERKQ
eukprot:scaffold1.g5483.t1